MIKGCGRLPLPARKPRAGNARSRSQASNAWAREKSQKGERPRPVGMAELFAESSVLTLDHDFRLYRKSGRHVVPVMMPEGSVDLAVGDVRLPSQLSRCLRSEL